MSLTLLTHGQLGARDYALSNVTHGMLSWFFGDVELYPSHTITSIATLVLSVSEDATIIQHLNNKESLLPILTTPSILNVALDSTGWVTTSIEETSKASNTDINTAVVATKLSNSPTIFVAGEENSTIKEDNEEEVEITTNIISTGSVNAD